MSTIFVLINVFTKKKTDTGSPVHCLSLFLEKTVLFILGTAEIEKESVKVVFNLKKPGISGTVSVL